MSFKFQSYHLLLSFLSLRTWFYFVSYLRISLRGRRIRTLIIPFQGFPRTRNFSGWTSVRSKTLLKRRYEHALSKVRMSSHRLEMEAGRWHRPHSIPLDERKCRVCNIIEDEFHFILECTLFQNIRKKYIKRYFWLRPNIPKFIELMTSENKQIIRNLASYVFESFKIRNSF